MKNFIKQIFIIFLFLLIVPQAQAKFRDVDSTGYQNDMDELFETQDVQRAALLP